MTKRILSILGIASFLLQAACGGGGGGGNPPPPPPVTLGGPQNPADLQAMAALQNWIGQAVSECGQAACQFIQANQPFIVGAVGGAPGVQSGPINSAPPPGQGQCSNAVRQVVMNLNTMGNGQYGQRPDVHQYIQVSFFQPVGNQVAQCAPPLWQSPGYIPALMQLGGSFATQVGGAAGNLPPWALPMIQNGFSQYHG